MKAYEILPPGMMGTAMGAGVGAKAPKPYEIFPDAKRGQSASNVGGHEGPPIAPGVPGKAASVEGGDTPCSGRCSCDTNQSRTSTSEEFKGGSQNRKSRHENLAEVVEQLLTSSDNIYGSSLISNQMTPETRQLATQTLAAAREALAKMRAKPR